MLAKRVICSIREFYFSTIQFSFSIYYFPLKAQAEKIFSSMRKISNGMVTSEQELKHFERSKFLRASCELFKLDLSFLIMVVCLNSFSCDSKYSMPFLSDVLSGVSLYRDIISIRKQFKLLALRNSQRMLREWIIRWDLMLLFFKKNITRISF